MCMCVPAWVTVPYVGKGPEEGIRSPRTWVPRGWELPGRCWEPDPDLSKSSKCPQQSQFSESDPQPPQSKTQKHFFIC